MTPTDHKAALRKLAAEDGCEASRRAAAHIEYIERRLASSRNYSENLRRKLERVRHQRDTLRRQLMEKEHGGDIVSRNDDRGAGGAAVEPV